MNENGIFFKVKQNWTGENIEIDENTAEEGEVTEETTKLVAETIEPVAENNFPVAVAPDLTREGRNQHPPVWLADYNSSEGLSKEDEKNMAFLMISEPVNFEEAAKSPKWRLIMDEEIKSIEKNKHRTLVVLPVGAKRIGVKWIYKTKLNESGEVDKYKARLVVKGYTQEHGIDYTEVYAPAQ